MLEGVSRNRKPAQGLEECSHPENQSVAVLIQLSSHTYYIPTTHYKTCPGEIFMQSLMEHIIGMFFMALFLPARS